MRAGRLASGLNLSLAKERQQKRSWAEVGDSLSSCFNKIRLTRWAGKLTSLAVSKTCSRRSCVAPLALLSCCAAALVLLCRPTGCNCESAHLIGAAFVYARPHHFRPRRGASSAFEAALFGRPRAPNDTKWAAQINWERICTRKTSPKADRRPPTGPQSASRPEGAPLPATQSCRLGVSLAREPSVGAKRWS